MEVIVGTREELYWLKVPEKLRRQAVEEAALGGVSQTKSADRQERTVDEGSAHKAGSRRKRKR